MMHSPDCTAQNANTLFGDVLCICDPKWRKKQAKAAKATRAKKTLNPCKDVAIVKVAAPTTHYRVRKLFKPSTKQLAAYAATQKHKVPQKRTEDTETGETTERDTFDDEAVSTLRLNYPKDRVYPYIANYRILGKAKGTYLDKMTPDAMLMGADGRLRDAFRHSPKTLRLAMELLQVLPRPLDAEDREHLPANDPRRVYDAIRCCFVPTPGYAFFEGDFKGIEPLLVAYLMRCVDYLRACRLDSHSWVTAFVVGHPVDFNRMSDSDVREHFADLKARGTFTVNKRTLSWGAIRQGCKTAHMTSLYVGGPGEVARANPDLFPKVADARYVQDMIFELIPLKQWHMDTCWEAWNKGYLTMPSGLRLHAGMPFTNKWDKGKREETYRLNRESKEIVAAGPQHLGMMYTATATLALAAERPDLAQYLRLLIHDAIFSEVPVSQLDDMRETLVSIMQRPHPLMPLWPEASVVMNGDSHLRVAIEHKASTVSWGDLH